MVCGLSGTSGAGSGTSVGFVGVGFLGSGVCNVPNAWDDSPPPFLRCLRNPFVNASPLGLIESSLDILLVEF